jgi:cell division protein FtsW
MGERTDMSASHRTARKRSGGPFEGLIELLPLEGAPQGRSKARKRVTHLKFDVPMLLAVITLIIFGLIMVYSASYDYSLDYYDNPMTIFFRQVAWLGIGLVAALILAFMDYTRWKGLVVFAMGFTILLLIAVFFVSDMRNNAVRSLYDGSVQPSELAKFMTVVYLAVWLYAKREQLHDLSFGLLPLAGILGLVAGLILLQPDLSAVITILMLGGLMFFLAGGDLRQIIVLLIVALLVGYFVVVVSSTGEQRIIDYLAGLKDPTQGSYHVQRSFEAFVKGGWWGVGIGEAETKLTGLPVPHTDSIFAVVGEETGVLGTILLVGLYVVMLWRGISIARRAPDQLGALLAAGLTFWISIEAFINMAVMVNLLPFAGNALPFISSGGSSLVMTLVGVGILMNVSRLSERSEEENDRFFNAVINLRGRDWRRGVPSNRRSASSPRRNGRR